MRPNDLNSLLTTTIPAGLPVLIKGAPGVGKTDIVTQAAKQAEAELIIMHPVVSDPTDFKGLPGVVEGSAEWLPFGELRGLIDAEEPTVAFLDDLGQAPAVVQAAAMQLILGRRINGHQISDDVVFVAATNRREDKAGVTSILEPVKSRFSTIVELDVNTDDWAQWALAHDVSPEIVAFVRFRPGLMVDPGKPTQDIVNRPSPRTVTQMAKLYALGVRDLETLSGAVGEGFATEFIGFLRCWQALPDLDEVLDNPKTSPVPTEPDSLYAVTTALVSRADEDNGESVIEYLDRLPEEFSVMGIRDLVRAKPDATHNNAFVNWSTRNAHWLT